MGIPRLAARIATKRRINGMSQAELAEFIGTAAMTVHRWERGISLPCGKNAVRLMEVLDILRSEFELLYEDALMNASLDGVYATRGSHYVESNFESWAIFLEWLIALDYRNIPNLSKSAEGTAEQWAPLFQFTPSCWRLLTHNDIVVGYWHYLPLKRECFDIAKGGELLESELSMGMTVVMISPGRYLMYITMFLIDLRHRAVEAWNLLRKSFLDELFKLARAKFFFSDICCCTLSVDGIRLCEDMGLSRIGRRKLCGSSEIAEIYLEQFPCKQPTRMFFGHSGLQKAYADEF